MSHRAHLSRILGIAAAALLLLAGCAGDEVTVTGWQQPAEAVEPCVAILDDAPELVADQEPRPASADHALAWGDPAIILRCGVAEPADLEPTSPCHQIGEIGWFAEEGSRGTVFTTIGREFSVSVEVPEDYEPQADALVDLESVIAQNNPEVEPCV